MGKILGIGLWVCIVTLGAVYGSIYLATAPAGPSDDAAKKPAVELIRGEPITIPVIGNGDVTGYFLTRISFMMDKEKAKGQTMPTTELMTDQLFTLLVGNKMVDIGNVTAFDVNLFREKIKTEMNARLGEGMVDQVLIEQLDYVSKEAARKAAEGAPGPMAKTTVVEAEKIEEKPASSGH
ncbi:MAG: flagellar basal body-associated FliL family protein [Allorhizobium sp.]